MDCFEVSLEDFHIIFHGNLLQNTSRRTAVSTEYIFSRWILVNNVITWFITISMFCQQNENV